MRIVVLPLLLVFLLSACGQSGPLYLPQKPNEERKPVPTTPAAAIGFNPSAQDIQK